MVVDIVVIILKRPLYPGVNKDCSTCVDTSFKKHQSSERTELLPVMKSAGSTEDTIRSREPTHATRDIDTSSFVKDMSLDTSNCSSLIASINYNQLMYFLLANLLTGVVNLSINTHDTSEILAFIIMNIYLIILHSVIMVLYKSNVSLRL